VLRKPAVAFTNLTGFLVGIAMFSSFLVFPQFAQAPESTGYGFGFSVTAAGFLMLPTALTQLAAGPPAAKLGERIGFRSVLTIGAILITLSFLINTFAHEHPWELVIGGMLMGVGITFGFAAMANLIVDAVPQTEVGIATGINTVMRTVGGSFGAAIVTAILTSGATPLPSEELYTTAFAFSAVAGFIAVLASLLIPRGPRLQTAPAT
jgi:MFS family permease